MVRLKAEFGVRSSGFGEAFTVHRSPFTVRRSPFGGALRRCGPESQGARHQLDANSNPFRSSRPLRLCGEFLFRVWGSEFEVWSSRFTVSPFRGEIPSSQQIGDQGFLLFQLVQGGVDFFAAEIVDRDVLNNFPRVAHGSDWE